jgi:fructose-bisphosphate aldolase, class II
MSTATLSELLQPALRNGYAVAGLVCLGWEDMRAYAAAAEAEGMPIILQAGPACLAHTPLAIVGKMLRLLAETANVPVAVHLDHGKTLDECRQAVDVGFTSIMFDGSRHELRRNIDETAAAVELAHRCGVSCEGELGYVGYRGGQESKGTDPGEAGEFARNTGVDALAISIGNVHLQETRTTSLNEASLRAIEAQTDVPLVIHGGSGVSHVERTRLARRSRICKFNIGTELRMAFGSALRVCLQEDHEVFDRLAILGRLHEPLLDAARLVIRGLGPEERRVLT